MYELIDAREHGQEIERPLLIVERYHVGKVDQLRRVFALREENYSEAKGIVEILNDPGRQIEEEDLHVAA